MSKTNTLFIIILLSLISVQKTVATGYHYDEYFRDSTLRIDYTFSGNAFQQSISLDKLNLMPGWYGKRTNMDTVPVEGNGQITVKDHKSQQVVYKNSFSTLFQEWLTYDEAKLTRKSFENVFLVPMPKDTVDISIELKNNRKETVSSFTHTVSPTDILIRKVGFSNRTPYTTMVRAKNPHNCIHIAFLAEGYKEDEMPLFIKDTQKAIDAIFAHEPFKTMKERFNIIAVKSASKESGTSEPSKGLWKDTALGSHFDTFYSDRYLTTLNLKDMHDLLAGTPYEHIIVLVNTEKYGGGGILNSYNLSMTHHPQFCPVVVHEFGHSFAGLADEYAYESEAIPMYPHDVEPWEPNITTLHHFDNKWRGLMKQGIPIPTPETPKYKDAVGVYEGAGYSLKGVYRSMQDCRMRTNSYPNFCPVCQRAIQRVIDFYTQSGTPSTVR